MGVNRFITGIVILCVLCQGVYGQNKLAKDTACDDPEVLAAARAYEDMLTDARAGRLEIPPHLLAIDTVKKAMDSGEIPRGGEYRLLGYWKQVG